MDACAIPTCTHSAAVKVLRDDGRWVGLCGQHGLALLIDLHQHRLSDGDTTPTGTVVSGDSDASAH